MSIALGWLAFRLLLMRGADVGFVQDEEFLYLVMEYLPGGDVMVRVLS